MQDDQNEDLTNKNQKKNQKNIYVHKIKSLMRISQDSLHQNEREITEVLNRKHLKKVKSEVDKTANKLEKNRESAKRARIRKKLYIKLLESRVERLKETAEEGQRIENECLKFSQMICKKEGNRNRGQKEGKRNEGEKEKEEWDPMDIEMEEGHHRWNQRSESFAKMDKLVEEICQISMCSSLRNIRELSSQISMEEIIRAEQERERQQQGEELQQIIKEVLVGAENLRGIYTDLMVENQNIKKTVMQAGPLHPSDGEARYSKPLEGELKGLDSAQFSSFYLRNNETHNIFINLTEGERIMIEGRSYLQQKLNEESDA